MLNKSSDPMQKIRRVADYQFGRGVGEKLFPDNTVVLFSMKTRRVKQVYLEGELLATLKPTNGLFSLTPEGATRLMKALDFSRLWVEVQEDAVPFVEKGGDVFAKHVVKADESVRPGEEVAVIDGKNLVIAVGRAVLSGREMKEFKRGVAVNVRSGRLEKVKKGRER